MEGKEKGHCPQFTFLATPLNNAEHVYSP